MKAKVIFIPDDYELPEDFDATKHSVTPVDAPVTIKPRRKKPTKIPQPRKPYIPKPRLDTEGIKLSIASDRKCARCGYNEFHSALCYHHTDPTNKSATVSSFMSRYASSPTPENWQLILDEVAKCVVLCANCHNALHAGQWKL